MQGTSDEDLNTSVYRILTSMMKVGVFDDENPNLGKTIDQDVTSDEHYKIAREINE